MVFASPWSQTSNQAEVARRVRLRCKLPRNVIELAAPTGAGPYKLTGGGFFHQEAVAVMADVEAMFHQVKGSNEDKDLLRFLWWPGDNYEQDLVEHKLLVHIFGATSLPRVASFALHKCATDFAEECGQETAKTVLNKFLRGRLF